MSKYEKAILCDVDGVLGDFVGDILKKSGSVLTPEDIKGWNMFEQMHTDVRDRAFKILKTSEFWLEQTVLPHAQQEVAKLREQGHVLFVTHPWTACKTWTWARATWLEKHFKAKTQDIIFAQAKEHVQGQMLIDDKYDNIIAWKRANPDGRAVLMDRTYNLDMPWEDRVRIGENGWEFY